MSHVVLKEIPVWLKPNFLSKLWFSGGKWLQPISRSDSLEMFFSYSTTKLTNPPVTMQSVSLKSFWIHYVLHGIIIAFLFNSDI